MRRSTIVTRHGELYSGSKTDLIPRFLERCPEFQDTWNRHLESWGSEEQGAYNDLTELARFVVDCYGEERFDVVSRALSLAEEVLRERDPQACELVTIGLLEDIQTISSNRDFGYRVFEKYLGELSLAAWYAIERQWAGKSSLMDVVRAEMKGQKDDDDV